MGCMSLHVCLRIAIGVEEFHNAEPANAQHAAARETLCARLVIRGERSSDVLAAYYAWAYRLRLGKEAWADGGLSAAHRAVVALPGELQP